MNRRPSSFRSIAVAAAANSSPEAMYYRPYFREGRSQGRRGYSDGPWAPSSGDHAELVSGDSHFRAVQGANRGFRPSYHAVPPPPQFVAGQHFYGPGSQYHRAGVPVFQQFPGPPRPYRHPRPVGPAFGNHQQFRPQQVPQEYRPRASKPPDYRDWEYAKRGLPSHCERFSVLSYNILADYLARDHYHKLYFHIPRYMMDWNWRKRNITFELGLWSADILCFQEVDRYQDLEAELRPRGYSGIWKMRTGDPADGCAIFWRDLRFELLHEESIEYNKLGLRDNVAQICVFESLNGQNNRNGASTMSASGSSGSFNRVVVCNIHVLFNPKRGDVKLGQIRVLLDRAHAISKLWDDAPVVICGDFNCTPKSPMYNFITDRQLDLSELPRDKVSGQASAEIHSPRPAYPDFSYMAQAADNNTQASAVNCENIEQRDLPLDSQNLVRPQSSTNASSTGCLSIAQDDIKSPKSTEVRECVESNLHTFPEVPDNQNKHQVLPENHSSDPTKTSEPTLTSNSDITQLDEPSKKLFANSLDAAASKHTEGTLSVSAANDDHDKLSYESASCEVTNTDVVLDEKFELLSLNESVDGATNKISEDSDSFLSELHSDGQSPIDFQHEILNNKLYVEHENISNVGNWSSCSSAWTPAEIQTATGSSDNKIAEHPLKLTSAYADVQNSSGLRDSCGEPFITSYHKRFSGTVDYIWHTEGLQTVKILAPIPKHVMQQTRGFPTKKWGSDHIALVSEFAFANYISSENTT